MSTNHADRAAMSRREVIQHGAAGAALLTGLGAGLGTTSHALAGPCTQAPAQTAGPYWVDEMLNRSDIRSDPATGVVEPGFPLRLGLTLSEITGGAGGTCAPLAGAYIDLWQTNALGEYSDVAALGTLGKKFLRGYQISDSHGNVRFLTIYPGYYPGRTAHIHFRVRKFSGSTVTFNFVSQLYFNDTITTAVYTREAPYNTRPPRGTNNSNDGIFNSALLLRLADNGTHALASFNIVVNSNPGLTSTIPVTPTDEHSMEHLDDFGGGTPPLHLV